MTCINYSKLIAIRRISNYCLALMKASCLLSWLIHVFAERNFFYVKDTVKLKFTAPLVYLWNLISESRQMHLISNIYRILYPNWEWYAALNLCIFLSKTVARENNLKNLCPTIKFLVMRTIFMSSWCNFTRRLPFCKIQQFEIWPQASRSKWKYNPIRIEIYSRIILRIINKMRSILYCQTYIISS